MPETTDQIRDFLAPLGWADAHQVPLTGDASRRSYRRLTQGPKTAILMLDPGGSIPDFLTVADYLKNLELRPPSILGADHKAGLCLLEDFGDQNFARRLKIGTDHAKNAIFCALSVLERLADAGPLESRAVLSPEVGAALVAEGLSWLGADDGLTADLSATLHQSLARLGGTATVTSLRDYHAENLMWLAQETGHRRAGLLDFQDAVLAPPVYDVMSLLTDPRQNLAGLDITDLALGHGNRIGQKADEFLAGFAVWSVQRNLRIAGIFTRLVRDEGQQHYGAYLPRTWDRIASALDHPELPDLRPLVDRLWPGGDA